MFGVLPSFSRTAGEGRSLWLHGARGGSMLVSGESNVHRFWCAEIAELTTRYRYAGFFFMVPVKVMTALIRSFEKEGSFMQPQTTDWSLGSGAL